MKFAQYLEDTQTPEWKKAYINYRALKKRIAAIRKAQEYQQEQQEQLQQEIREREHQEDAQFPQETSNEHTHDWTDTLANASVRPTSNSPTIAFVSSPHIIPPQTLAPSNHASILGIHMDNPVQAKSSSPLLTPGNAHRPNYGTSNPGSRGTSFDGVAVASASNVSAESHTEVRIATGSGSGNVETPGPERRTLFRRASNKSPSSNASVSPRPAFLSRPTSTFPTLTLLPTLTTPLPMRTLLPLLPPEHVAFFTQMDAEHDKVDAFFSAREAEAEKRTALLRAQMRELMDHRRVYYAAHVNGKNPLPTRIKFMLGIGSGPTIEPRHPPGQVPQARQGLETPPPVILRAHSPTTNDEHRNWELTGKDRNADEVVHSSAGDVQVSPPTQTEDTADKDTPADGSARQSLVTTVLDPEEYQQAKKKLKRAVLEHYRGLEVLSNYRILNLTGFRKALKKYEKVTKVPAQKSYVKEKIETSSFASGEYVLSMIKDMEELFAARFERGDKKRAMTRLRATSRDKSHHFSTFRSGVALGLSIPPIVSGLYQSFQSETREAIPGWDGLLYVYSTFLVPVLFALLVGVNMIVWTNSRINYVFIFELDVRTKLDYREYFELPSYLLTALSYAFFLSFSRIGSPTIWPLVWLAVAAAVMLDPLPLLFKPSRWWLVRNASKLLASGVHRVEFTDFWMGDQFCSLVYTLSNLYLIGCVYTTGSGLDSSWRRCTNNSDWPVSFVLAIIPFLARLVQSIRRYIDSRLITHLINGGKYGAGILYYFFYYNWRRQGSPSGSSLAIYCFFATCYSIYASSWDFLMDWSLLRPRAKYPLLRPELLYSNYIPFYYVALVTNLLLRFSWVIYVPERGPSAVLRTFIAAMLEILRRTQWNLYRLENEHLGNVDQYRVTREVPLPYSFDKDAYDDDEDGDEDESIHSSASWLRRRRARRSAALTPKASVRRENEDNESQS